MRSILRNNLGIIALFSAFVFAAFGRSWWQGYSPVDDSFLILNNLAIRGMSLENLKTVFTTYDPELYIPFVFISYQLNYILGGLDPSIFHLTNILLHIANALLVARILFQLSGKKGLALFAGLLFAVHPLNTEAVVWLAGRKDLLSAFFFFLALTSYLQKPQKWRPYILSILFFLCALLSKVTAVTFLGVIVLHALMIERKKIDVRLVKRFIPYGLLSGIFMLVALGGKSKVIDATTQVEKIFVATKSSIFYLQKMIAPINLTTIYPLEGDILLWSLRIFPSFVLFVLLTGICIHSLKKRTWLSFAILWYLGTLAPTFLNIGKGGSIFFAVDRYAYLPMVAILFVLITLLGKLQIQKRTGMILAGMLLCILTGFSALQTRMWDGPEALYKKSIELYPSSVGARVGLSSVYRQQGKLTEAFEILREGLQYADHVHLRMGAAIIYAKTGRIAESEEQLNLAAALDPEHPEPVFELGNLYEQTGRSSLALLQFEKAVEMDESYVVARAALANLYVENEQFADAREQLTEALDWNISSMEANMGMALLLEKEGKLEEARPYLDRVLALNSVHREAKKLQSRLAPEQQ